MSLCEIPTRAQVLGPGPGHSPAEFPWPSLADSVTPSSVEVSVSVAHMLPGLGFPCTLHSAPSAHLWEFLVSHFVSQPRQRHPISIGRCRCRTDLEHLANLSPALAWPKGELRGQDLGNLLGRLCTGQVCAVPCLVLIGLRARIRWAERGLK